uniref:Uncharacterized protein n=1 Tax=Rhizophora mucronata TaxID=61149 RepID=A0A2P2L2Q1_RHIMU
MILLSFPALSREPNSWIKWNALPVLPLASKQGGPEVDRRPRQPLFSCGWSAPPRALSAYRKTQNPPRPYPCCLLFGCLFGLLDKTKAFSRS